ncbi:hypothetical protein HKX48_008749 [Thoreauomyces humboldtii]|nr:hypothetical protein HKX48_008749 [Thoreauomyces humboldtii]
MSSVRTSVVLVGLPSTHPAVPIEVQSKVAEGLASIADKIHTTCPDLSYVWLPATPEADIETYKRDLLAVSPRVQGVVIGMGIRGNPKLSAWFETLVNVTFETLPGVKLLFNSVPGDTLDAIRRGFPEPAASKD